MWAVNECFVEMVSYLPIPSPFTRFGGEWVDGALGFAMAWNFFLNNELHHAYPLFTLAFRTLILTLI